MKNKIHQVLKEVFGYDEFRPLQEEIIKRTMEGKDSFVLMPTGGGKSICFQVPALLLEGITIVVSPLISLMKDQVQALQSNGIEADFFNSTISLEEENRVIQNAKDGHTKLLYMSPEKLISVRNSWLQDLKISLVAIDEAHCVSMWGHDFRQEYTQLKDFRDSLPSVPFIALTATADKSARQDIEQQLGLKDSKLFISSFDRKNLSIEVRGQVPKGKKLAEISFFIGRKKGESGIIYCLSRKNTEEVTKYLKAEGHDVAFYHAGMDAEKREKVQTAFINDEIKIIAATIAFGMGIDKSNVRWVIHYNLPKNLEGYYQEIGRAGRDGLPSETRLYYNMRDFVLYSQFAEDGANEAMQKDKLSRMLQFAEAKSCRRKILLAYFGEYMEEDCGNCDVCENPPKSFDGTIIAQKALSGIARMGEKEGVTMLINILRGSNNAEVSEKGYQELKTYGAGSDISFFDWRDYIIQLANKGLLEIMYIQKSALKITHAGWKVLKGEKKIKLTRPISEAEKAKKPKTKFYSDSGSMNDGLFEELKKVRFAISKRESVPAYIIFNDKTLKAMSSEEPVTENAFLAISGVGLNKMRQYGDEFMSVIKNYKKRAKPTKMDTTEETFNLYKEGLAPLEIAQKRGIQVTTVYSHLAQLYKADKEVDLSKFVNSEAVERIEKAIQQVGDTKALRPIFEELNEEISYGEIRLGIAIVEKGST